MTRTPVPGSATTVPASHGAQPPGAALLYLGAFDRRSSSDAITCTCRRAIRLRLRSMLRPTTTSGTHSQAQFPITFPRPAAESEVDLWKLVDGFDRLRSHRASSERGHWTESLPGHCLVKSLRRPAPGSDFRSPALDRGFR